MTTSDHAYRPTVVVWGDGWSDDDYPRSWDTLTCPSTHPPVRGNAHCKLVVGHHGQHVWWGGDPQYCFRWGAA